jgi:hypothetical protein
MARSRIILLPCSPLAIAIIKRLIIISRFAQLPIVAVFINGETKSGRQSARLQKQSIQFIPPELAIDSRIARRYEHGRRNVVFFQQRFCVDKIIGISIIESHNY